MGQSVPGYRNDEPPFIDIRNIWSIDAKHPILINRGLLVLPLVLESICDPIPCLPQDIFGLSKVINVYFNRTVSLNGCNGNFLHGDDMVKLKVELCLYFGWYPEMNICEPYVEAQATHMLFTIPPNTIRLQDARHTYLYSLNFPLWASNTEIGRASC